MKRLLFALLAMAFAVPVYADCVLQADTADAAFAIGPFFDSTDGVTRETALTITSSEVILKKKGSTTFAAKNDATACTHRDSGWYTCPLNATDTDTEGNMIVEVEEAGSTGAWRECLVVGAGYYDLVDGTTSLMTSRQAGNVLETTIVSAAVPTVPTLTAGASNDDAYNNMTAVFVGGTEECERQITDYAQATKALTLRSACPFTLAAADTVRIHVGGSGDALAVVDSVADSNASAIAALNDITARSVWAVDATDEQTQGTFGQLHGDPAANAETIYEAVVTDASGTNIAADIAAVPAAVWTIQCEDQGGGLTCQEVMSIVLAEAAGTAVYTSGTRTWVVKDPSGTETRLTIVYGAELDGDRTTSTLTPMTP